LIGRRADDGRVGVFDFFFYGTLVDADVRRLVLGRDVPDAALEPALLRDHRRYAVIGQPYPAIVPEAEATTDGVILPGAGVRDAAILSCFEGAEYGARECPVVPAAAVDGAAAPDHTAWVFIASERVPRADAGWSIEDWQTHHKPAFIDLAKGWLDGISVAEIAAAERLWQERLDAAKR
jgi:hypothetical protein